MRPGVRGRRAGAGTLCGECAEEMVLPGCCSRVNRSGCGCGTVAGLRVGSGSEATPARPHVILGQDGEVVQVDEVGAIRIHRKDRPRSPLPAPSAFVGSTFARFRPNGDLWVGGSNGLHLCRLSIDTLGIYPPHGLYVRRRQCWSSSAAAMDHSGWEQRMGSRSTPPMGESRFSRLRPGIRCV